MARLASINKANKKPKFSTRAKNRCKQCGRPRGYYRDFGVCRICLRKLALNGQIPGMVKASW
ncbi:MAG: type Z 30S ribosomal protein S14 [Silvanigrellales bacterium]|nr:type Z 30S ribosomal protein S14 [Silvanigrellales bacterium]